jgi:DNA invertase Pin-like site-specific DNA recombinase
MRWSKAEQSSGDSKRRQREEFLAFCVNHDLTPADKGYADEGVSGFSDKRRTKGSLGRFIELAKRGAFEKGTVLVVEAWDRLSRERPDKTINLVQDLLRTGVSIGVCRLNNVFSEGDFGTEKFILLTLFAQLAFQESQQKSDRLKAVARARKRRAAEGIILTGNPPAWIRIEGGKYVPIPDKAETVKYVFKLAGEGIGVHKIVQRLTNEDVPPIGKSGKWTKTYVEKILTSRRAVGEYQPRFKNGKPDGPPVPKFFPEVVTDDEWIKARQGAEGRRRKRGRPTKFVNIFVGLIRGVQGEPYMVQTRTNKNGRRSRVLITKDAAEGRASALTYPYIDFEANIIVMLREAQGMEFSPRPRNRLAELNDQLAKAEEQTALWNEEADKGHSKYVAEKLRNAEAKEDAIRAERDQERLLAADPIERTWNEVQRTLMKALETDEERLRLRRMLRDIVEEIRILIVPRGRSRFLFATVCFTNGEHRDYLMAHRPSFCNGTTRYAAEGAMKSWKNATDLRDPKMVEIVKKVIELLDVNEFLDYVEEMVNKD